ncbi:MAG TPA: glycosyltransferase family 39 protein, partial [Chthoniobacterales bacterium]|nr:glycosyltransferase family 39 protein [Chthoniobacterales bacterium]
AAFLPMQLYLSQYVTNETLAATLTTVSAYFAVRVLIKKRAATWELLVLGLCLGAAMLSKATSLLLIPPVLLAFAIKCWQERAPFIDWLRALGVTTAAIVLICGWHYLRIWRHFGTPIVGNWDPVLGFGWWQDPGFHTARDYIRFGRALTAPLFSGFQGIPDGLYSTLWGDSLAGGTAGLFSRSPWNYSLMLANYWVSIVPTILVLIGVVVAARLLIQRRLAVWVLLLGFSSAVIVALIFMTLKVPSYAQVKAFYGLSALVPFCAFAVLGWGVLSLRSRILELSLTAALIFLALNSVGSFWIRPTIEQRMYKAIRFVMAQKNKEALVTLAEAEKAEPSYAGAKFLAGAVFDELGEISKAVEKAREATQLDPNSGGAHLQLAISLGKEGDLIQAMAEAQRALELEPENGRVYTLLFALAYELHRSQDALAAGRDGLGVTPFDPAMHFRMGLTAGELGDFTTAVQQFAYALLLAPKRSDVADKMHLALRFAAQSSDAIYRLKEISTSAPDSPQLLNELAWIFSTSTDPALRDGTQALDLARRARELTGRKQPALLATEAAAYAESGKFSEAINSAQGAASLAQSQGDAKTVELAEKLLTSFQSNQPYREELH